jgi:hypothetical protein
MKLDLLSHSDPPQLENDDEKIIGPFMAILGVNIYSNWTILGYYAPLWYNSYILQIAKDQLLLFICFCYKFVKLYNSKDL